MAIFVVVLSSLVAFIWHATAAYPSCSHAEAIKTREEAIGHTIEALISPGGLLTAPEYYDEILLEMIQSDEFRETSSKNWIVRTEPTFFYNQAWYVRYWDQSKHVSIVEEFDRCRRPIKEEYDLIYEILFER